MHMGVHVQVQGPECACMYTGREKGGREEEGDSVDRTDMATTFMESGDIR